MKKLFTLLIIPIFSVSIGYAQISLPINFDTTNVSTSDITSFDGGTGSVVANPLMSVDNPSDSVGQVIRNGGQVWAGALITLGANLDFSTLDGISMKVYTTAPVGTILKFKLEGAGGVNTEVDLVSTDSAAWVTYTWSFAGKATIYDKLVFLFDFGALGDGTGSSTFYFDDIQQISTGTTLPELPINFDSTLVTTSSLVSFDGGTGSVIANPQMGVDNPSDSVGQLVRNGGQIWAGTKITLGSALDFTTLETISMKVYTDAPAGTVLKFKLEGSGAPTEVDVASVSPGTWQTYTWNFAGQPATFTDIVLLFDFGNVGDGTAASTFLFDDIQQVTSGITLPELPIDFDSTLVTVGNFIDFDGGVASVISNPQMGVDNPSDSVGQIIRNGGQIWAGSKLPVANNIDFSTLGSISMNVFTTAPAGTVVKFKLEGPGGANTEVDMSTTVSGSWETLTWDFTGQPTNFNTLVLMFDFGNTGDGSATSTFLFDDIEQIVAAPPAAKADLPINFDSNLVTTDQFEDFDGGGGTVIANPQMGVDNPSDSVGQIIRNGGQVWAGSKIALNNNIDFSTLGYISMKVYTDAPIGTTVKFKLEGTGGVNTEVDVLTTVSGGWETMRWDFTGQPTSFNTLVLMFDFGNTGDGSATSTFLFDDIMQADTLPAVAPDPIYLPIDFETVVTSASFVNFDGAGASVIANPQSSGINTSATVAQIVRNGGEIWAGSSITLDTIIDFSTMAAIQMKVFTDAPIGTTVKFKLEGDSTDTEVDMLTTVSGDWETLSFDFTGAATEYHTLVFMFDFGNVGDSSASSTFLFDDIEQALPDTIDGIAEAFTGQLEVYPNPSNNVWNITSHEMNVNITAVEIYNTVGTMVYNKIVSGNGSSTSIDGSALSNGIYYARISTNKGVKTMKILKK